jgi:hypothetical protein
VVFTHDGTGRITLPDGDYYAVASRGLEYELDQSEVFRVDGEQGQHIQLQVYRSIDTTGWISADFHVHSAPSHDSGVSAEQRIQTYVAEGVEFFAATDHDVLTDFAPTVETMGVTEWVQTSVGVETTTVELGHYLGFPLQRKWLGDVGGAFDWTGATSKEIVQALRDAGDAAGTDPVVFIGHPRSGILGYFDQYGLDTYAGAVPFTKGDPPQYAFSQDPIDIIFRTASPLLDVSNFTLDIDALELFTGKELFTVRTPTVPEVVALRDRGEGDMYQWLVRTLEEQQALEDGIYTLQSDVLGSLDDWMAITNLGARITALGNSDTHGTSSIEAGCPRNYVMSSTDSPGFIDDQAVADAVKDHRVVASFGPFVEMFIDDGMIGDEIVADGDIDITVEVQAPSWVDIDRVAIYENGGVIAEFAVEEGTDPQYRYRHTFTHTPTKDSWYVAIVSGDGPMDPVFTQEDIPMVQLDDVVAEVLGVVPAVTALAGDSVSDVTPRPRTYVITPFALTNPIWVDIDGDGWTPPGLPDWWTPGEIPPRPE